MDYSPLKEFLTNENCVYRENEIMAKHTTFKIGGPADIFAQPSNEEMLIKVIKFCKENEYPVYVLGNGSNLLVSDLGVEGVVVHLDSGFADIQLSGVNEITCGSALRLSLLCNFALENGLSGLEFAWGIPGLVGGAVYMNAGAYGSEVCNIIKECRVLTYDGNIKTISAEDMKLGYRTSLFKETKEYIILSATFSLIPGERAEIREKMEELIKRRKEKQPLEYASAGSTFKRPTGNFAGTLIEMCGLKGLKIGNAMVSEKHAGFVVNLGDATASDVKQVIEKVKDEVFLQTSVKLEPEVEFWGR